MTDFFVFLPSNLEIDAGDTVTWVNQDDFDDHDATSSSGLWGTGVVASGDRATVAFLTPGTYPYGDSVYFVLGMTGTIVVKGATSPPPPATLTNMAWLAEGSFRFSLTNLTPNLTTVIEISTNLSDWEGLATNFPTSDSLDFTNDAAALLPQAFYRAYQMP